jgi:HSP20 family molecular chaperone IbpA
MSFREFWPWEDNRWINKNWGYGFYNYNKYDYLDNYLSLPIGGDNVGLDVYEGVGGKSIEVIMELPGVDKEDIKIEIEDNYLVISGKKQKYSDESNRKYLISGIIYGPFKKYVTLNKNIDRDNIEAKYENGVLYITLNKVEKVKKPIKIS